MKDGEGRRAAWQMISWPPRFLTEEMRDQKKMTSNRRDFLKISSAALLYNCVAAHASAASPYPLGLPLGLQLYSVREMLPTNYEGTLKQIAELGYREVEAAGFYGHSAAQVKQAMKNSGLRCVSAHYSYNDLQKQFEQVLDFNRELGVSYIICSFPGFKDPARLKGMPYKNQIEAFTIDDWRWNAEQFNHMGEKVRAAGMRFGYHNHTMEFRAQNGVVPYVELLRLTDPALVTMEMDCGWVVVGGGDPVEYLRHYPTRISMLHVKDFKRTEKPTSVAAPPPAAELGQGTIDYRPIFKQAAIAGHIRHCFVEQEEFDKPAMECLKIDADYMRNLKA